MTESVPQKQRTRRTPEQQIADLQVEIERIKQRAAEREAKNDPTLRHVRAAVKSVDKALMEAEDPAMRKALEDCRATLSACLNPAGSVSTAPSAATPATVDPDDILRYLEKHDGSKAEELAQAVGVETKVVSRVLKRLREEGRVRAEGRARGVRYFV